MNYSLNAGEWNSVFAVPSSVVDKYIKLADAGSLKLLLYLLRHGGRIFTDAQLKEALGFRREGELEDAAVFWVQRGIIRAESGSLRAATEDTVQEVLPEMQAEPATKKATSSARAVSDNAAVIYTASDIAERIKNDSAIAYLFSEAQKLYGRLLRQPESRTVLLLVDHYGLPAEVAAMLLKYCFKIEKTSSGYIQSVAQTWADDGINDIQQADTRLAKLEKRFSVEEKLREAMELKTKFSSNQLNYIKIWTEDWDFNLDMIMLAYEATLDNTGGMSFRYTNKVLENWKAAGITTPEGVKQAQESRRPASAKKPKEGAGSSLDVDDVMQDILQKYRS